MTYKNHEMRKLFLFFTLSVVATVVMAVPAKRGLWRTILLSDGTEVKVQLVGDEHGHWLQAADGATYQRMADSEFYQQADAKAGKERAKARRSQVNAKRVMRLASRRVGEVGSYTGKKKGIISDIPWTKTFVSKSVEYQRDVVPIHFGGRNSNFFYRLANFSDKCLPFNLAMLFLVDEMYKNVHKTFRVAIGKPIPWQTFDKSKSPKEWAQYVRQQVYTL